MWKAEPTRPTCRPRSSTSTQIDLTANRRSGKKLEFQVDLELDDANERHSLGAFLTAGSRPGRPGRLAGRQLWNLMEQKGKIQMRHYDTDADTQSVGLDAVVAGGGIAHDTTSAELTSAEDYESGQGFVPSVVCAMRRAVAIAIGER